MLDILIRKKDHPGKIKKDDKRLASNLNYEGIVFPVKENILRRSKYRAILVLMCLAMKISWSFQLHF